KTDGTITASSITADLSAAGSGVSFVNNTSTTSKGITLTGTNVFDNNHIFGLSANSKGAITLNSVTAICNGFTSGCSGAGSGLAVTISNSSATSAQKVTLTGTNIFNNNFSYGLTLYSLGDISIANATANNNGSVGLNLGNNTGTGKVTLTGVNTAI